jgi:AcrR family transcriptional regulator
MTVHSLMRSRKKPGPKARKGSEQRASEPFDAREQLLSATHELLKERIAIEPPVAEIAARAGVNGGLVNYYFGGKDGMLVALLERNLLPSIAGLQDLVDSDLPATEKLKANINGLINLHFRFPYINQLLLMIVDRSGEEEAKALSDTFVEPACKAIAEILRQGSACGEIRDIDPMLYYYTVQGACDRIFSARYSLDKVFGITAIDRDLKKQMVQHTIDLLLQGMIVR